MLQDPGTGALGFGQLIPVPLSTLILTLEHGPAPWATSRAFPGAGGVPNPPAGLGCLEAVSEEAIGVSWCGGDEPPGPGDGGAGPKKKDGKETVKLTTLYMYLVVSDSSGLARYLCHKQQLPY